MNLEDSWKPIVPTGPVLSGPLVVYHNGTGTLPPGYTGCLAYLFKLKKSVYFNYRL